MQSRRLTIISLIIAVTLIGGALLFTSSKNEEAAVLSSEKRNISQQELATANGKNGQTCYVAVDKVVYEIKDAPDWIDGKHVTSDGQAYCGADMSQVIDKSPHGRKMLDQLVVVGRLTE